MGSVVQFIGRTARLLFTPGKEFARIAPEPQSVKTVLTSWIIPWVLIMFIANVIGASIFGLRQESIVNDKPGEFHLYFPIWQIFLFTFPSFVQSVVMPFVMALGINMLAGFFGAQRDYVQALRTAAYVGTAAWLVGVFGPAWELNFVKLFPPPSLGLFVGVLWSIWLLFRALPPMMQCPSGKALLYTGAIVVTMLLPWRFALKTTFAIISSLYGAMPVDGRLPED